MAGMSSEETPPAWAAWVAQAEHDWEMAQDLHGRGKWSDALVYAEQAAEKWVKALWIARHGKAAPRTHLVGRLLAVLGAPEDLVAVGQRLGHGYFASRYPDVSVSPPFTAFEGTDADAALGGAEEVIAWVRSVWPSK